MPEIIRLTKFPLIPHKNIRKQKNSYTALYQLHKTSKATLKALENTKPKNKTAPLSVKSLLADINFRANKSKYLGNKT